LQRPVEIVNDLKNLEKDLAFSQMGNLCVILLNVFPEIVQIRQGP